MSRVQVLARCHCRDNFFDAAGLRIYHTPMTAEESVLGATAALTAYQMSHQEGFTW